MGQILERDADLVAPKEGVGHGGVGVLADAEALVAVILKVVVNDGQGAAGDIQAVAGHVKEAAVAHFAGAEVNIYTVAGVVRDQAVVHEDVAIFQVEAIFALHIDEAAMLQAQVAVVDGEAAGQEDAVNLGLSAALELGVDQHHLFRRPDDGKRAPGLARATRSVVHPDGPVRSADGGQAAVGEQAGLRLHGDISPRLQDQGHGFGDDDGAAEGDLAT